MLKIAVALLALIVIGDPADARKNDDLLVRNRGEPFCYWFGLLRDCRTGVIDGRDGNVSQPPKHRRNTR